MLVSYGDRLPTVALAQSLLVAHDFFLPVDGHFGHGTREAVTRFQRANGIAAGDSEGAVTPRTWQALSTTRARDARELYVVEEIDGSDNLGGRALCAPYLQECRPGELPVSRAAAYWVADRHAHAFTETRGGPDLLDRIAGRHSANTVDLLRFHGHGRPGHQSVFWGTSFDRTTIGSPSMLTSLGKLRSIMRRTGSIELHGCNTGMGAEGRRLLQTIADATGVPVSAGRQIQFAGPTSYGFVGSVQTCCPGRRSLGDWAGAAFGARSPTPPS